MNSYRNVRNFTDDWPDEVVEEAAELAEALSDWLDAERRLDEAKKNVPSYTGQWCDHHYYIEEQHARNVAINHLWEIVMKRPGGSDEDQ